MTNTTPSPSRNNRLRQARRFSFFYTAVVKIFRKLPAQGDYLWADSASGQMRPRPVLALNLKKAQITRLKLRRGFRLAGLHLACFFIINDTLCVPIWYFSG